MELIFILFNTWLRCSVGESLGNNGQMKVYGIYAITCKSWGEELDFGSVGVPFIRKRVHTLRVLPKDNVSFVLF